MSEGEQCEESKSSVSDGCWAGEEDFNLPVIKIEGLSLMVICLKLGEKAEEEDKGGFGGMGVGPTGG